VVLLDDGSLPCAHGRYAAARASVRLRLRLLRSALASGFDRSAKRTQHTKTRDPEVFEVCAVLWDEQRKSKLRAKAQLSPG